MKRLACVSIDLDELPHYQHIHGLPSGTVTAAQATAVYRTAPARFCEALDRKGLKGTLFAVGRDLHGDPGELRRAATQGFELANHTDTHDYALARLPDERIAEDIRAGADAIALHTGMRPLGFRAPGYTFTRGMYAALVDQGYAYGSSTFPAVPYYAAKAAVLGVQRLLGRRSASILDSSEVLGAPTRPYFPDPERPYHRGRGPVPELPVTVLPGLRWPFIGTFALALSDVALKAQYALARRVDFLNLELHGVDLMDASECGAALAQVQRDLNVPAKTKLDRLAWLVDRLAQDYEVVTLLQASAQVP